nr:hypothetical protein [Candidatus Sigynarchaeota archaeon]
MSAIPKYILKRMILENAVKLDKDFITIKVLNVLSNLPVSKIPPEFLDVLDVKIDDVPVLKTNRKAILAKCSFVLKGKIYPLADIAKVEGDEIPIGEEFSIVFPNVINLKKGEKHKFAIEFKVKRGLSIEFERVIQ